MLDQVLRLHLHLRRIPRLRPTLRPEEMLPSTKSLHLTTQEASPKTNIPSGAAGGPVSGSRAHAQPSASPDPAKGRQDAPSVVHSSQPHRSRNHTLAVVLAMTQYPLLPGTSEYGAWRAELHAHLEFARLHHHSARTRSRRSRDLGAGPSALKPSFLRACHTPLLSLAPGAALKSWG
jgi:hypothetical protein